MNTPWGTAQTVRDIADGIVSVTTASHGGIWLHAGHNAQIPQAFRTNDGWYEEDCEWAFVALTFPHHFEPSHVQYAHLLAASYYPGPYATVYGPEKLQQIMDDEAAIRARLAATQEQR